MEIRHYWSIIVRRWWVAALVFALAAAYGAYQWKAGGNIYNAQVKLVVRQLPAPSEIIAGISPTSVYSYDSYYRNISSEYLVDDYDEVVKGRVFADAVAQTLTDTYKSGSDKYLKRAFSSGDLVYGLVGASRIHRIMTLDVNTDDPAISVAVANAAADTLVSKGGGFFPAGDIHDDVGFAIIDYPKDPSEAKSNASKKLTTGIIIALLGLIAGLALVFLLEYLDDRVRDVGDAQRVTSLPVIGTLPPRGRTP